MRMLIADDHPLFRDGLRRLLETRGIEVVGEANNGREAVQMTSRLRPDLVLMDLNMPEMNGLAAARLISAEHTLVTVVVMTASEDDADLFEAIKSGAQGCVSKNLPSDELFRLLDGVANGDPALTPALAGKLLEAFDSPPAPAAVKALTKVERDVLDLLAAGAPGTRGLAERLAVSESAVKEHLRDILSKLHLQHRAQVVAYVLRYGMGSD